MTTHKAFSVDLVVPLEDILAEAQPADNPLTFANVAAFAAGDTTVSEKQRKDAASAFKSLFRKIDRKPLDVELGADPDRSLTLLFNRLEDLLVVPKGSTRRNIKSRCRKVLHRYLIHIGYLAQEPPQPPPLPPEWQ